MTASPLPRPSLPTELLADLGEQGPLLHPMPEAVRARLDDLLDTLDATAAQAPSQSDGAADRSGGADTPLRAVTPLTPRFSQWAGHGSSARHWMLAAAAAVVAVLGITATVVTATTTPRPQAGASGQSHLRAPALPVPGGTEGNFGTVALSVLGHNTTTGPLAAPSAQTACVAAAGLNRPVLGSTSLTYQGHPAVLIVLAGPRPPKVTALVVGDECAPDNAQVLWRQDIG